MHLRKRAPGQDSLEGFEPRWWGAFLAGSVAALAGVAVVRRWRPDVVSYDRGVSLAVLWLLGFYGVGLVGVVTAAVRRSRHRRALRGMLCVHCHYDLRASPGRCPECGREGDRVAGRTKDAGYPNEHRSH